MSESNRLCVLKDIQIESLRKKTVTCEKSKVLFQHFESNINLVNLKALRSVPIGQKNDSKFITLLLRILYADNLSTLSQRNVSGRNKLPITPTKKQIIDGIFKERIIAEETNIVQVELREKSVNTLLGDAILNIARPFKRVI